MRADVNERALCSRRPQRSFIHRYTLPLAPPFHIYSTLVYSFVQPPWCFVCIARACARACSYAPYSTPLSLYTLIPRYLACTFTTHHPPTLYCIQPPCLHSLLHPVIHCKTLSSTRTFVPLRLDTSYLIRVHAPCNHQAQMHAFTFAYSGPHSSTHSHIPCFIHEFFRHYWYSSHTRALVCERARDSYSPRARADPTPLHSFLHSFTHSSISLLILTYVCS